MDDESFIAVEQTTVATVFEADSFESTEDPPMEEWSSLEMVCEEENYKRQLQEQGLYDPGTPDICTKYIELSSSSVQRHVYYRYPAIVDPGILEALLKPEKQVIYSDDGQDTYLSLCKQMNQSVVRSFHRGLLNNEINLAHYCVNPSHIRAMTVALKYNKMVKKLNFTDNFLNNDAAYHLGDMLASNSCLVELNLSGCRLGPLGVQNLLVNMINNRTLKVLNLSKNEVGDVGMEHFATAIFKGFDVKNIDLSSNNITGNGVSLLVEPLQTYNKFTHWNLSWNKLGSPGTAAFLIALAETTQELVHMNLSWNGLKAPVGFGLKKLLTIRDIQILDLSHNQLSGDGIRDMCGGMSSAKNLVTLDLSNNPLTTSDAIRVLKKLKLKKVKVAHVNMDNVTVDKNFLTMLDEVLIIKPNLKLTYGYITGTFKPIGPDFRTILFKRMDYVCQKPKKNKVDIALVLLQLKKEKVTNLLNKDFYYLLARTYGASIDNDLIETLCAVFAGPRAGKGEKTVNVEALIEFSARMFPDRKLPPTPPPELEPPPQPPKKGKGKGKGKK